MTQAKKKRLASLENVSEIELKINEHIARLILFLGDQTIDGDPFIWRLILVDCHLPTYI